MHGIVFDEGEAAAGGDSAAGGSTGAAGAAGAVGVWLSQSDVIAELPMADYVYLFGLTHAPADEAAVVDAVRRTPPLRLRELADDMRLSLAGEKKARERLRLLLRLLDHVGAVELHNDAQQMYVRLRDSTTHEWYNDVLALALERRAGDSHLAEIAAKVIDMQHANGRAEFWQILKELTNSKVRHVATYALRCGGHAAAGHVALRYTNCAPYMHGATRG